MPNYPGVDGHGPVVLAYLEDQQVLAACGSNGRKDQSCHQLSPGKPTVWEEMPPLVATHCHYQYRTRSHYLSGLGWFVLGHDESCDYSSDIQTELFTAEHQWIKTPTTSPYPSASYPGSPCSVALNSTAIIITGGYSQDGQLSATWLLDLTDYSWTRLRDMPGPRYTHGCMVTAEKEVLIAGGQDSDHPLSTVYIYSIENNIWRQAVDLPDGWKPTHYRFPVLFLWNDRPILLEQLSNRLWILQGKEEGWKQMEIPLGVGMFNGEQDSAILVPRGAFNCI